MGLLANDVRVERRAGLRALFILLLVLAVAFAAAWLTIGRAARFQSLKGAYFSLGLPDAFIQIDEEGTGGSITSLGRSARVERTYSAPLRAPEACRTLKRSFNDSQVDVLPIPGPGSAVACSFSGPVGRYSVEAAVRSPAAFVEHVKVNDLDVPALPEGTRSVTSILVRS